ncbi:MAG: sigma-54-dependent Fis family transcriptional regulator [Candidatus Krumholzibacteriota bacterium]|nr:sigma-54-dependent Fis family transcriptional regulator [Candidatus Krumholzibacteriota bacterium]
MEKPVDAHMPFDPPMVGRSPAVLEVRRLVRRVAGAAITVLVEGESGTGKEIVARNVHRLGPRRCRPLVIVNCMELPETLLQSELFGHRRGAFTGASHDRAGLIESADGGTFFLDEIGELPLRQQAALLRVIQEREVRRIGESARRRIDVRFVFATNRDLAALVAKGRFREDLYFRVRGAEIRVPPLRERIEDIRPLAEHFLRQCRPTGAIRLAADAFAALAAYPWPGNVRELRHEIDRACALHPDAGVLLPEMLSPRVRDGSGSSIAAEKPGNTLPSAVKCLELRMIRETLDRMEGNRTRTASALGITRQGLLKKMKRYRMIPE